MKLRANNLISLDFLLACRCQCYQFYSQAKISDLQTMITTASTQQSKDSQTQWKKGGEPSGITKSTSDKIFIHNHLHFCTYEKPMHCESL